ncbi:MAG TPA: GNAT family N-acetyltransferase, partial [Paracoccaceae bacterium]|nr:GNAT family N-acetyltransferase [Paracoccaceae bacterium]
MTPEILAALHARAFTVPRPWGAAEFAGLLVGPGVVLLTAPEGFASSGPPSGYSDQGELQGFILGRVAAGEAEVLTVAVEPALQGRGIGGRLVACFLAEAAAQGAVRAFLEVAEDNAAARAVYTRAGFASAGRRRGYFVAPGRAAVDA